MSKCKFCNYDLIQGKYLDADVDCEIRGGCNRPECKNDYIGIKIALTTKYSIKYLETQLGAEPKAKEYIRDYNNIMYIASNQTYHKDEYVFLMPVDELHREVKQIGQIVGVISITIPTIYQVILCK